MMPAARMYCGSLGMVQGMTKPIAGILLLGLLGMGCSQNFSAEEPGAAMAERGFKPVVDAPVEIAQEGAQEMGPFTAVAPGGWIAEKPTSSMRVAQYRLSGPAGDAALAAFYFGPGQGGGLEANIERWYGQFSQPDGGPTGDKAKRWDKQVGDIAVTIVDISGTFAAGMGNETMQENYRMLGAIAVHSSGAVFFKLTGPRETVAKWDRSFDEFLGSLTPRENQI